MLSGLVATFVSIILFGLSPSYAWAVGTRFMWGLLNGNIGVAKSYLAEICDNSNMARGFSTIGLSAGLARFVAPVTGAYLASPVEQWPDVFAGTIFETFPYLLPCLVGALICAVSFVSALVSLQESDKAWPYLCTSYVIKQLCITVHPAQGEAISSSIGRADDSSRFVVSGLHLQISEIGPADH